MNFFLEVKKNINEYLEQLAIDKNQIDIFIQRSWATISHGNETIAKHKHMQSHISFAYYLKKNSNDNGNNNDERISISADIVCIAKNSETLEHLTPPYDNWKKI